MYIVVEFEDAIIAVLSAWVNAKQLTCKWHILIMTLRKSLLMLRKLPKIGKRYPLLEYLENQFVSSISSSSSSMSFSLRAFRKMNTVVLQYVDIFYYDIANNLEIAKEKVRLA